MSQLFQFSGYKPSVEVQRQILPRGGYIGVILKATVEPTNNGRHLLVFRVDVAEGPYKGFYRRDYELRQGGRYEARYNGRLAIFIPMDDGSELDQQNKEIFNMTMGAIEDSNPGFVWNREDLNAFNGKMVGLSVREYMLNGGVYTEIGKFVTTKLISDGSFRPMRMRVSEAAASVPTASGRPHVSPQDYLASIASKAVQEPTTGSNQSSTDEDDVPF